MDSSRQQQQSQAMDSARSATSSRIIPQTPTNTGGALLFVAQQAEIQGKIQFGENCIVHPKCQIIAEGGDIIFGEYCIIEEKVRIINRAKKDESGKIIKKDMRIGSFNFFEVYSQLDSTDVGDMNEF